MRVQMMGLALLMVLGLGCGDDTAATPDGAGSLDSGVLDTVSVAPSAEFKGLTLYDGIKGTTSIEVTTSASVTKVELLADNKVVAESASSPFTISFDSTKATDGVVKLMLKAHAGTQTATSKELSVVIYNNGAKATWIAGNSGTMTVQPQPADNHLKYHWNMPDSVKQVITVLSWKDPKFKMELAIGTGTCPHSGQQAASSKGDATPIMTTFGDGKSALSTCQWFAHGGATNETEVVGQSCNLSFETYLLK